MSPLLIFVPLFDKLVTIPIQENTFAAEIKAALWEKFKTVHIDNIQASAGEQKLGDNAERYTMQYSLKEADEHSASGDLDSCAFQTTAALYVSLNVLCVLVEGVSDGALRNSPIALLVAYSVASSCPSLFHLPAFNLVSANASAAIVLLVLTR
ncbi:hypothetical protein B0F90DRAFT_1814214 [Multifurca ochricompacta]|uniref:Uncharacterized protein n=1 Tax=Multifurca ochricompacta TaxID=376703 RepID=A0AAD4M9I1_9AGAM|nr:hypothetical protein B0F90DRAFT_1814214 [Multifurca ochricompacta]